MQLIIPFAPHLLLFLCFLQNFALGDKQGAGFYDLHGTTLHLFVLFPVQYIGKHFALETREIMTTFAYVSDFLTKDKRNVRKATRRLVVCRELKEACMLQREGSEKH